MLLVGSGAKFVQQLEQSGALAIFVTPEGGSEGHYLRRLRGAGYEVVTLSSKGIGDLASYLTRIHGVRPATLGKSERRTYFFPGVDRAVSGHLAPESKGVGVLVLRGACVQPTGTLLPGEAESGRQGSEVCGGTGPRTVNSLATSAERLNLSSGSWKFLCYHLK
jgi:hypothetical protein